MFVWKSCLSGHTVTGPGDQKLLSCVRPSALPPYWRSLSRDCMARCSGDNRTSKQAPCVAQSCPPMPNRERREPTERTVQRGTSCHKKGVPNAQGDKRGNKAFRWMWREKMLMSQSTGPVHMLSRSQCLPHAGCLPRQKPPKESSGIHASPFPNCENISGLGPKSPVFEGGKKKKGHICSSQR